MFAAPLRNAALAVTVALWGASAALSAAQAAGGAARPAAPPDVATTAAAAAPHRTLVDRSCVTCHNARVKSGGLALDGLDLTRLADDTDVWEKVARKVRAGRDAAAGRAPSRSGRPCTPWSPTSRTGSIAVRARVPIPAVRCCTG